MRNERFRPGAFPRIALILLLTLSAQSEAAQTGFRAQSGEIDASYSDIASGNFGARRDSISGWANWSRASARELKYLQLSDNYRYRTADPGRGDNAAMIFEYEFSDQRSRVSQIDVVIEVAQAYREDAIFIYLWDYDSGSYDVLGSDSGTRDTTLSYALSKDPGRYLSPSGALTLFVVNQDDYGSNSHIRIDHIAVIISSSTPHFSISHNGGGSTCSRSEITITKHDASDAVDTSFVGSIGLSTSTGVGSWELISGSGKFSNGGNGAAKYAFGPGDMGQVVFGLTHTDSGKVDIDVFDGSQREGGSEDPILLVSAPGSATVRDSFDIRNYSGNNGTASWAGDWVEVGETNGAFTNTTSVSSNRCASRYCLRIGTGFSARENFANRGARREANLLGASSATLSFKYFRGYVSGTGIATVAVSNDGGTTFTTLATYTLNGNTTSAINQTFNITPFISANTQIRFMASVRNATTSIYIDDIQIRYETACTANGYFVLGHDSSGVHCQNEPVSVSARDANDRILANYNQEITLTTQTGSGTFATTASNQGVFNDATADDGLATYVFSDADNGVANFLIYYSGGSSGGASSTIDLDVYDSAAPTFVDDDSEGLLSFTPSAFMLTANMLSNPTPSPIDDPVGNQVAGTTFPIYLAAFGTTTADPSCGIIENYDGVKSVSFWSSYLDPMGGIRRVTINGTSVGQDSSSATNLKVSFTKGQAAVRVKYKDVGQLRLSAADTSSSATSEAILGASNAFVSIPADLEVSEITRPDLTPNPQVAVPTGERFVAAGHPFRATVRSLDAEGDLTPNFGFESKPERIALFSASLIAPVSGRNGVLDNGAIGNAGAFSADATRGSFSGSRFSFSEVGAIRLRARVADGDYLGAGSVIGSESEIVGRFIPSRFEVTANSPRWETTCALGAFSWIGQPFSFKLGESPTLVLDAVNARGQTTQNYSGDWWRLTNASLANRNYSINLGTLDTSGLPGTTNDPAISGIAAGQGTLAFSSGSGLAVLRQSPIGPGDGEIELSIDILDLDGVAYPGNPFRFGGTTPGTGMAFDISKRFHFGRIRLENSFGSELVNLPMRMVTQRFDGLAFVDDDFDNCTSIAVADLSFTPTPGSLASAPTIANDPLLGGQSGLVFSAPRSAGSLGVIANLGPGGANLPWLQFDWPSDGNLDGVHDDDPSGTATFGIWKGRDQLIYMREVY